MATLTDANRNKREAIERGEKQYLGTPCKYEHSGMRFVNGGGCVECRSIYEKDKDRLNKKKLWRRGERRKVLRHGSTTPTRPMPAVCELCGEPPESHRYTLDFDHCHATGKFRAWLCGPCNRGLGAFKDDPILLRKAADMLEIFNREVISMSHDQFLKDAEDGKIDEDRADEYLMRTMTRDQIIFLLNNRLSVGGIMNGRYTGEQESAVHEWQQSVNRTLGGKFWLNC